jgi:hypothetical protein
MTRSLSKPGDPDWDKGAWYVHFTLRCHFVKQAISEARTQKQAEQVEIEIKQAIFDGKYNKACPVTLLSDFIDKVYVPWSRDNKRSHGDDKQRAEAARDFFGPGRVIRDITPMLIDTSPAP